MFGRLHHVALAVADLDAALELHTRLSGAGTTHRAQLEEQQVEAAVLEPSAGGCALELVAPLVAGEGPVGQFLARRGEGLHHIAWEVSDLDSSMQHAQAQGHTVLPGAGRIGLHGTPVAFLHPGGLGGVLCELVEAPR